MNRNKGLKRLALFAFLILPLLFNVLNVQANTGEGGGDKPTGGGNWGHWWNSSGKPWTPGMNGTEAWHKFYNKQVTTGYTDKNLKSFINRSGRGFKNPDGSYQSLVESCQKSEYIWWYGGNPPGTPSSRQPGSIFTQARNTHNPAIKWEPQANGTMQKTLDQYKNDPNYNWKSGNIVLVCSGVFAQPTKPNLFFQANSDTFDYDGAPKTVSGVDTAVSNYSQLKPEHEWKANPTKTATDIGTYDVPFPLSEVKIFNKSNGIEVTEKYNIVTKIGKLIIEGERERPPDFPPSTDYWRCIDDSGDSATAFTFNTTTGYHGFTPTGAPGLNSTYNERYTPAGEYANNNSLPSSGDSLSSWESWKSSFESGSDEITPDLDLESAGVSGVLSQYGGIYNIMRTLTEDTYNVTHCQPQIRERFWNDSDSHYDDDDDWCDHGYWDWTEWENDGGRIISSSSGPLSEEFNFNYQILSVNCNKEGFNSVLSSTGGVKLSKTPGDGSASLQTAEEEGVGPGPLGRSGTETGSDGFYNDGTSCKEAFWCTVQLLPGATHDASNNRGDEPLFTEEQPNGEHGQPYENNLIFFRDNVDREVRADVWYPRNTGLSDLKTFPENAADITTVNLYGGTPEIELTKIAPWHNKYNYLWDLGKEEYNGHVNRFLMKSQWASDKGKPYEMGINWLYEGKGTNIVPSIVDGYEIKDMTEEYEYYFDVYCEFKNETGDYKANIPDTPFAWGYTYPEWSGPSSAIRTLFTRSVSDTQR